MSKKLEQFGFPQNNGEMREKQILELFSEDEQREILHKKEVLSGLAKFIGKDFDIPVELNPPGGGWYWDFKENIIRIDTQDLLERPMDELRDLISHEGSHRRISRMKEVIPEDVWKTPGFSMTENALEDPRVNNFLKESYPISKEQMRKAYDRELGFMEETRQKVKENLGFQPRFMRAGFEFLIQWHKEARGEDFELSEDLPEDVREAVGGVLEDAQSYWWRYPSKEEADEGEDKIVKYMGSAYDLFMEKIWPVIEKLVEKDKQDEELQKMLQDMQKSEQGGNAGGGLPEELKGGLSDEQQKELEDAIEKAIDKAIEELKNKKEEDGEEQEAGGADGEGNTNDERPAVAIDLDSLSDELKEKLREYLDALPEDEKEKLEQEAQDALGEAEKDIVEEMHEGVHPETPGTDTWEEALEREEHDEEDEEEQNKNKAPKDTSEERQKEEEIEKSKEELKEISEKLLNETKNAYEAMRREVLPIIDKLEQDLREIFVKRRMQNWKSGYRAGKRISIKKRMQEKAKGVSAAQSKAWQKREAPSEKDYAISLLTDLSGSMGGQKIEETFKAVVVLTEVLSRLSIKIEILGFNDRIHEFKSFQEDLTDEIREKMGAMLREVNSPRAAHNDDGWALGEAAERLATQDAVEKFLIALSDGQPVPSARHNRPEYDLNKVINKITDEMPEKLVGLGVGPGTGHVESYYPNSIANVSVEEMAEKLADLIYDVVEHYDEF